MMLWLLLLTLGDDPTFLARTATGKDVRGPLVRIAAGWEVELGEKVSRKIPGGDLLWLQREPLVLPDFPTQEQVILLDGSRIPIRDPKLKDDDLCIRHPDLGSDPVAIPLTRVRLLWRTGLDREPLAERTRRAWLALRPERDQLRLRNGDLIEGTLEALGDQVVIDRDRKTLSTAWAQTSAILIAAEEVRPLPTERFARVVVLPTLRSPGGRFTLLSATLQRDELVGKTPFGATLRVPLNRLARLEIGNGAAVPLSQLKPQKVEYMPYLDESLPLGVDATVRGRDLRLGGTWEQGLSMAVGTRVTLALGGKYRRLEALAGLDEIEGKGGQAKITIMVDDKKLLSQLRDPRDKPLPLRLDLAGVQSLTLQVEAAGRGPIQGVVNLVDAWLVR